MSCGISIVAVSGVTDTSGNITSIRVEGTAQDCDAVIVQVNSAGIPNSPRQASVSGGVWSVEIPRTEFTGAVRCGQSIEAIAVCRNDRNCLARSNDKPLECRSACPRITITLVSIGDECVNGRRSVTLRAAILTSVVPTIVEWDYGDGSSATAISVIDGQVIETTHDFLVGVSHQVALRVVYPDECRAGTLNLGQLPPCPAAECPSAARLELVDAQGVVHDPAECVPEGRYQVRVVQPTGGALAYHWTRDNTSDPGATGSNYPVSVSTTSPNVTVAVAVVDTAHPQCPPLPAAITVRSCERCPAISLSHDSECTSQGRRDVTWRVGVQNATSTTRVEVDLGDGTTSDPIDIPPGAEAQLPPHGYTVPGSVTASVRVISPRGCEGQSRTVELRRCGASDDDETTDDGAIDWCSILRFVAILFFGLFGLSLGILLCPAFVHGAPPQIVALVSGISAAVSGGLFVVAIIAWSLLCRPRLCDYLAMAWQGLFLVSIVFIYFWACPACVHIGLVGLFVLMAAGVAMALWIGLCRPTLCAIFNQLLLLAIVFDIVGLLEIVFGWCVITSFPAAAIIYAAAIVIFNLVAYWGQQTHCRITPARAQAASPRLRSTATLTRAAAVQPKKGACKCQDHDH